MRKSVRPAPLNVILRLALGLAVWGLFAGCKGGGGAPAASNGGASPVTPPVVSPGGGSVGSIDPGTISRPEAMPPSGMRVSVMEEDEGFFPGLNPFKRAHPALRLR